MPDNVYAIIDEANSRLINLIVWDGDTNKWQPPEGTVAKKASEVDFSLLTPEEV